MKKTDIILIIGVVLVLAVAFLIAGKGKTQGDLDLPLKLVGEVGLNEITYDAYEEMIDKKQNFMIIIGKTGCDFCTDYMPIAEAVANEYQIPIAYINISDLSQEDYMSLNESNKYLKNNRWGTPTTLLMVGDRVVDNIPGFVEKEKLVEFLEKYVLEEE